MNRRQFIYRSATASATLLDWPLAALGQNAGVSARISVRRDRPTQKIAEDFSGLSYESAQLGNPRFFAGDNTELIGFVRRLGNSGVLRIGGNTSEYCYWNANPEAEPQSRNPQTAPTAQPASVGSAVGPDKGGKTRPAAVNILPMAIRNLRDFLDATGWKLIYGLNMGTGSTEQAVAEAAYVMQVVGPKLIAFQLANEPDIFYRNGLRRPDYNFEQFADEWQHYFQAIRSKLPAAPFAGPDTAYKNEWLVAFAKRFQPQVRLVSQHYYAEGPPEDPSMTIERLLQPNPKLQQELEAMKEAAGATHVPFRLAETNSCYHGGKPGVSDTFASALWAADLMYQLASEGAAGINFHGGGYGWYTPIAGSREHGFVARPIYYGMLLFAEAGPGQLVEAAVESNPSGISLAAYALEVNDRTLKLAVLNKTLDRGVQIAIDLGQPIHSASLLRLYAPRVDDAADTTFAGAPIGASGGWSPGQAESLSVSNGTATANLAAATAALITCDVG